ncbi:MAG: hypothetical protein ACREJX_18075, partial [Polyangiaceae bacterium]
MRRRSGRLAIAFAIGALPSSMVASCGSRTDLDDLAEAPESEEAAAPDQTSPTKPEASAPRDATVRDALVPRDAEMDAGIDSPIEIVDAGPPLPGIDASFDPDSGARCVDGGAPSAYLVADNGDFYSFDPTTLTSTLRATLSCS